MAFVQLRDQDIAEFIEMYEQEVGIRLSPEDAAATARRFLTLFLGLTGQLQSDEEMESNNQRRYLKHRRSLKRQVMKKHALPLVPH